MTGPKTIVMGLAGSRKRSAVRFEPQTVARHMPRGVMGVYLLYEGGTPIYVGRSDKCLRRRLVSHPLLGRASHVAWDVAPTADRAFLTEAYWFHELTENPSTLNQIHPRRPDHSDIACPYCVNDGIALAHALEPIRTGVTDDERCPQRALAPQLCHSHIADHGGPTT